MEKRHRITEREVALCKKKSELESALIFMRGSLHAKDMDDPNRRSYEIAVECIEREFIRVVKELV